MRVKALARRAARAARTVGRNRVRRTLARVLPSLPLKGGRDLLESEYRAGDWDYLASDPELPRFGVVAGYCIRFGRNGRVLEVGCGEGLLPDRMGAREYAEFVGIDVSDTAIARAQARELPNATFVAADAASFVPEGSFDVIVFHEVLEYFNDPVAVARRYDSWLADDGVLVVSQYDAPDEVRTRRIWRKLQRHYRVEHQVRISSGRQFTWVVKVLRPTARAPLA